MCSARSIISNYKKGNMNKYINRAKDNFLTIQNILNIILRPIAKNY